MWRQRQRLMSAAISQGIPEATRSWKKQRALEGPHQHLDFRLRASRTVTEYTAVVISHSEWICYGSCRNLIYHFFTSSWLWGFMTSLASLLIWLCVSNKPSALLGLLHCLLRGTLGSFMWYPSCRFFVGKKTCHGNRSPPSEGNWLLGNIGKEMNSKDRRCVSRAPFAHEFLSMFSPFLKKKKSLFTFGWIFIAARGLFSSCGGHSSHGGGVSCFRAWSLGVLAQ